MVRHKTLAREEDEQHDDVPHDPLPHGGGGASRGVLASPQPAGEALPFWVGVCHLLHLISSSSWSCLSFPRSGWLPGTLQPPWLARAAGRVPCTAVPRSRRRLSVLCNYRSTTKVSIVREEYRAQSRRAVDRPTCRVPLYQEPTDVVAHTQPTGADTHPPIRGLRGHRGHQRGTSREPQRAPRPPPTSGATFLFCRHPLPPLS